MKIRGAVLRTMEAPRPYAVSRPLDIVDIELDDPGPGEVLIKMTAAGLCHSDLSVVDGNRPRPLPMLLGHEGAGIVEQVGPGVDDLEVGDHVVTVFLPRCGHCDNCRTDGKLPCIPGSASNNAGYLPGFDVAESSSAPRTDDGVAKISRLHESEGAGSGSGELFHHLGASVFADHAVLNQASVVKIGHDVPPQVAAPLGCAVLTGGGAVINAGKPRPGQDVMIVGLGGVGMAALITASGLETGKIIGVDANPEKLDRARELGAAEAYTPAEVEERGIKAPVVIEAAGHPRAFETAFYATSPGGTTVTVGLPAPTAESTIRPVVLTSEARTVIGSYLGSAVPMRDIPTYEHLWREDRLPVSELVSSTMPLERINEALDSLADGKAIRQIILFD